MDELPETCPYSAEEVEDYFFGCMYEFLLIERPREFFRMIGFCAQKFDAGIRSWMFEAVDVERQRQWFIVLGTGGNIWCTPYTKMKRWIYAETNDEGLSPAAFLDRAYHETLEAWS